MKKFILGLLLLFVLFGTMYSHNAHSSGATTEVYVQDVKRQIAYLQQNTATSQDIATLRYLRQRLNQLGR